MWGLQYDENVNNNPFFNELITHHGDLVVKASQENWVICVPRVGVIEPSEVTIANILDHILVSSASNICYTLSKKQVLIQNKEITTVDHPSKPIRILFEETFYIEGMKYTIFCLDRPLFISRTICEDNIFHVLETLHDCIDFMWSDNLSHVLMKIQKLCSSFVDQNRGLAMENLQNQKDLIGSLFSQCLQIVLKNRTLSGDCENIKIAVETYMQSCLDRTLMKAVNTVTCFSDATLNKIVRNCSDLQLKDLNIPLKFWDIINAKSELSKINNYVTILDKVNCLKLTFNHLYSTNICLNSDDILQILVFLIIKSNISNWTSNLVYLTHFQFSSLSVSNETNFLITSLEAALEFIKSDEFGKIKSSPQTENPIFQTIITSDLTQLQELLKYNKSGKIDTGLCHPLCDCDNCTESIDSSHNVTMFNEKGQSLLTYATIMDRPEMVEFLLTIGAEVESFDYVGKTPLHYACLQGYQDVLLILMNRKADVNAKDHDGNTPLHLACNNGHENCVKTLFYTSNMLDIDCVNKYGDTPLHLAIKWNYVGVVRILLENNAVANVANKRSQQPIHLAQNYYTARLLTQFNVHLESADEPDFSHPSASTNTGNCKDHGIRAKGVEQLKKIDLLLKAIENNDFPLTCFYLGFPNGSTNYDFESKCHPLCNCEKCDDLESSPKVVVERVNVNTCNIDGFTPLHFAAKYGRTELLRTLLDSQALPNLKTYKTLQTPLHLACIYQRLPVVKELVKCRNCEVDALDYKGNTPLSYARGKNDAKIVEVLLSNGASCDIRNYQGTSIIKKVQEKNFFDLT